MNIVSAASGGEGSDASNQTVPITISDHGDIITARQRGRELASHVGFRLTEATLIAMIISELASNILLYAKKGEIVLETCSSGKKTGLSITCQDNGPGITDLQRALAGGYSTSGGLGLSLNGIRRMVDEFSVETGDGHGTRIAAKIWQK